MNDRAEVLLGYFTDAANKTTLHPEDWRRFYDFMIAVHRERLEARETEVRNRVWASHFPDQVAQELQMVFVRGIDLLKQYDAVRAQ